jgi:hypothetical protein
MAEAIEDDDEAEGADEAAEDEVPELPELQAARPRVRPAADTVTARIRRFTISPKVRSVSICSVGSAGFSGRFSVLLVRAVTPAGWGAPVAPAAAVRSR